MNIIRKARCKSSFLETQGGEKVRGRGRGVARWGEEKLKNSETEKFKNKGASSCALRGYGVRGRQRVEGCW